MNQYRIDCFGFSWVAYVFVRRVSLNNKFGLFVNVVIIKWSIGLLNDSGKALLDIKS